jgi:flavoprotein
MLFIAVVYAFIASAVADTVVNAVITTVANAAVAYVIAKDITKAVVHTDAQYLLGRFPTLLSIYCQNC